MVEEAGVEPAALFVGIGPMSGGHFELMSNDVDMLTFPNCPVGGFPSI